MTVRILIGDVFKKLRDLPADSIDCIVTSPPYWGLRDYGVEGQIGLERTLGEHLDVMVAVGRELRRVLKPEGTFWLNYGDAYATKPNGRSAADTKAAGNDDRTFRDKPFDTTGPIYDPEGGQKGGGYRGSNRGNSHSPEGRIVAGGTLKPKDLCLMPERLAIALQEDGWWVRAKNIWGKPNAMPDSQGKQRPSMAHEMIWMLAKSASSYYDAEAVAQPCSPATHARIAQAVANQAGSKRANGGSRPDRPMKAVVRKAEKMAAADEKRRLGRGVRMDDALAEDPRSRSSRYLRNYEQDPTLSVWRIPTAGFSDAHFATFPPELAELCILAGSPKGGLILDPFFGAGTVGIVADALGRECIGIELNPDYAALAARRLKASFISVEGVRDTRRGLEPLPLEGLAE